LKRFAVLGDPVRHSKSPMMHAAAYRALGLEHTYEAIQATRGDLTDILQLLRNGEYAGFNVTIPHKQTILGLVDEVAPSAAAVGAANTITCGPLEVRTLPIGTARACTLTAHNTDVPALRDELVRLAPERTPDAWRGSKAIVLGSGGAARAAIAALRELGVSAIVVRARKDGSLAPTAEDRSVLTVVQATSAGMQGADPGESVASAVAWRDLPREAIALDVVYAPPETPFLRAAARGGFRHANGLGMLAAQGALAFALWLGGPPPFDVMRAALEGRAE
jgi:shikimate dehydrogenase